DRSMRESGFDPSNRFGPFSAAIVDYAPVCLNVLLYRMEQDAGRIHTLLGETSAAAEWQARAQRRRQLVDRYLWDQAAGLNFGYTSNEVGFGWTNAAVVELLAGLERRRAVASRRETGAPVSVGAYRPQQMQP